ncbi:hypothetical protein C8J57DRAFT_314530 [Mycena rebaudengoi]|nr:hypothetical protein C8J57DRAFT_314530 [Mycena rebaudengoi]
MDTLPIQTYTHQLLRQQRGYPLYNTGPQLNLPDEYRETGVSIGDVGTVTADGIFDFYFNIFLPCNHPINAGRVPDDFVPLQSYTLDDVHQTDFQPGSYVSSPYPFFQELNSERSWDQFPGSALSFMCTGPTGALLALQCGSRLRQLKNVVQLRQHAEKYAESWYKYVNGPRGRGRGLPNGSLYLITGCEKSQAGGMATFNNVAPGEQFPLSFEPSSTSDNLREGYRFRRGTPAHTKTFMAGRSEGGDGVLCNQTAFLHGFSISLGDSIWERLLKTVKVNSMTDFALANLPSSVMPLSSITSSFFGPFGPEEGHGGSHRAEMCTTLSPLSSTPTLVHPSQIINDYILREDPEATVVLTHDDDWAEILLDDGTENVVRSVSEFLQRVSQRFQIEGENGKF